MKYVCYLGTALALLATGSAQAAETVTHQYDALGRLKQTTKSGGPATGVQTKTNHDPAGNRTCHSITGVGGASGTACPTPP
jgi:YD repeat-containing protein